MTSVDTNVVVRLLTGDEPRQYETAKAVFRKADIFVPETVFLEAEWVLRHAYGFRPDMIQRSFSDLCGLPNVILAHPHRMMAALDWYADGMDFADALHLAASQDCREFLTFDRKMIAKAKGRGTCRVKEA